MDLSLRQLEQAVSITPPDRCSRAAVRGVSWRRTRYYQRGRENRAAVGNEDGEPCPRPRELKSQRLHARRWARVRGGRKAGGGGKKSRSARSHVCRGPEET